jgi:hypothetical protein
VFPAQLGSGYPKYVWEATSHELGHRLGLSHDGDTLGNAYYGGSGIWAPIMGVSGPRGCGLGWARARSSPPASMHLLAACFAQGARRQIFSPRLASYEVSPPP